MVLGALHGPAELLPISSSGHTTALPWLFGSSYATLDPRSRKILEVALHAGAALGLLLTEAAELAHELSRLERRHLLVIAVASAPAGAAGLGLERQVEAKLGTPASIAGGLLAGGLVMALADRSPEERRANEAGIADGLWLGLAQAAALLPGVSRAGAVLAAARARRFHREDAARLSGELAWPVIGGATMLKAWRLRRDVRQEELRAVLAGGGSSLLSTLVAARLRPSGSPGPLLPYAIYRAVLAAAILLRLRARASSHDQGDSRPAL